MGIVDNIKIRWTFTNDTYWENTCNKCCQECEKTDKECNKHCHNTFIDNGFCGGCKYDEL